MTTEQLKELVEVLSVLSAKSSVLKERDELRALMEENQQTASEEAEVRFHHTGLALVYASICG